MNHSELNILILCSLGLANTIKAIPKMAKVVILLIGLLTKANGNISLLFQWCCFNKNELSTRSKVIVNCEISYSRFWNNIWIGKMGLKLNHAKAINILNTFPKLEVMVILMYFKILPNIRRSSTILFSNSNNDFLIK